MVTIYGNDPGRIREWISLHEKWFGSSLARLTQDPGCQYTAAKHFLGAVLKLNGSSYVSAQESNFLSVLTRINLVLSKCCSPNPLMLGFTTVKDRIKVLYVST